MADLSTTYLGLDLGNPVIVAASGLSADAEAVQKAVEHGAGAVVLKSLFEEQLRSDMSEVGDLDMGAHPEAAAFLEEMGLYGGSNEYLETIRKAKAAAGAVPLIASVNCIKGELWVDFAEQIEAAGADALELNIAPFPASAGIESKEVEDSVVSIVRNVSVRTKLPIAVKLGQNYTNLFSLTERLSGAGAKAVVLFNRFYRFDFDLDNMNLKAGPFRSSRDEYHESLRWVSNLYGAVSCQLCGGTGIHSAETALKFIAGGAQTVQVCSMLYSGGWKVLSNLILDLSERMDALGLASLDQLRGKLARRSASQKDRYERLQYIKALTGLS